MKRCTQCQYTRTWKLADGRMKCRRCGSRFKIKSVWESSQLSDRTETKLVEFFTLGVPVYRLRYRGIDSAPAIERFFRLIQACCAYEEHGRVPFEGNIECEESSFGGPRKVKRGWGAADKIIVFGILQLNGLIQAFPVQEGSIAELIGLVREHTRPGSLYYTDDWHVYASLAVRGDRIVIRKDLGRPKGRDHFNCIEGFWSYAKHWLYPYRGVPRKNFHIHLGEICYRFNHRNEDIFPLIINMLKKTNYNKIQPILVRIR